MEDYICETCGFTSQEKRGSYKCPVCGNILRLVKIKSDPEDGPGMGWTSWQVQCHKCGAEGPYERYSPEHELKKYAIDGWHKLIGNS